MGLESLFLFTLLGGLAAGTNVFETVFQRKRTGNRPWLVPLVVVVLFLVGMIAASTHVHDMGRAFQSISSGTVNFGAGMTREIMVSACFFVLALIDLIVTLAKKESPFALRVVTSVAALLCIVSMGTAYVDVYGNAIWCNAPATVLSFVAGDLAMGLALCAALGAARFDGKPTLAALIACNVVLLIGLCLEAAAFGAKGVSPVSQVAGLIIAPVASSVFAVVASRSKNAKMLSLLVFAFAFVGVAIARYSFYATFAIL